MEQHHFHSAGSRSDQAIEWLARLRAEDVTPEETADFATWLAASSLNKIAFDEATELWHLLANMPKQSVPAKPVRKKYTRTLPFAAAASVLVACVMVVLQLTTPNFATGKGEQRRVVLADGSTAFLNTASELSIDFSSNERRVVLHKGEVWFDVAANPSRPFIVVGQYAIAQAVGTAFAVREAPGFTRIGVTEGTVSLTRKASTEALEQSQAAPKLLQAGEQGTVSTTVTDYQAYSASTALAWQRGQLIYDDVRLDDLLTDLSRYLPIPMTVNDRRLESKRVSAVLYLDDQAAMLEALSKTLPISWKTVSDSLIIIHSNG